MFATRRGERRRRRDRLTFGPTPNGMSFSAVGREGEVLINGGRNDSHLRWTVQNTQSSPLFSLCNIISTLATYHRARAGGRGRPIIDVWPPHAIRREQPRRGEPEND